MTYSGLGQEWSEVSLIKGSTDLRIRQDFNQLGEGVVAFELDSGNCDIYDDQRILTHRKTIGLIRYNNGLSYDTSFLFDSSSNLRLSDVQFNRGMVILYGYFMDSMKVGNKSIISSGGWDAFVLMLNQEDSLEWITNFGSNVDDILDQSGGVLLATDSSIYVSGTYSNSSNSGDLEIENETLEAKGGFDVFVLRLNLDGKLKWIKSFAGNGNDFVSGLAKGINSIIVTTQATKSSNYNDIDFFTSNISGYGVVLLIDEVSGALLNSIRADAVGLGTLFTAGGCQDLSGKIYLAGSFYADGISVNGKMYSNNVSRFGSQTYICAFNQNGTTSWVKTAGGHQADGLYDISLDHDGLLLSGYYTRDFIYNNDTILSKRTTGKTGVVLRIGNNGKIKSSHDISGSGAEIASQSKSIGSTISVVGVIGSGDITFNDSLVVNNNASRGFFVSQIDTNLKSVGFDEVWTDFKHQFTLHPTITSGLVNLDLTLDGQEIGPVSLFVYNNQGQEVLSFNIGINEYNNVDLSVLTPGLYWCVLQKNNYHSINKIIKY